MRSLILLAAFTLMFGFSSPLAAASGDNTSPDTAAAIDNQVHSIPANASLWYSFQYAGDKSDVTVTLLNGTDSGLEFDVFTPAQIGDWWDEKPIGRGTPQAINCDTGLADENGTCQADDLSWVGSFPANGTYYVKVMNTNPDPMEFQMSIEGEGVTASP